MTTTYGGKCPTCKTHVIIGFLDDECPICKHPGWWYININKNKEKWCWVKIKLKNGKKHLTYPVPCDIMEKIKQFFKKKGLRK